MHWLVQAGMYHEAGMEALVATLERFRIPFTVVTVAPDGTLSPDPAPSGPVMACGSVGLARTARTRGWTPGSFLNDNHRHEAWMAHWGRAMLNADARTTAFKDVEPVGERVFIRPAEDSKYFHGGVMDADEVRAWRDAVRRGEKPPVRCSPRMTGDTPVVCGPPVTIYRESRFFVVDGAIVASSTYKQGGNVLASPEADPVSTDHARACVRTWQPARAFVLDTALTPDGPRVVEVNCINSAGFYGADVQRIVTAIEAMQPWAGGPSSTTATFSPQDG